MIANATDMVDRSTAIMLHRGHGPSNHYYYVTGRVYIRIPLSRTRGLVLHCVLRDMKVAFALVLASQLYLFANLSAVKTSLSWSANSRRCSTTRGMRRAGDRVTVQHEQRLMIGRCCIPQMQESVILVDTLGGPVR